MCSGGTRISHGGSRPRRGGRWLPRRLRFENFVCQNERIWTLVQRTPPRSANDVAPLLPHFMHFHPLYAWVHTKRNQIQRQSTSFFNFYFKILPNNFFVQRLWKRRETMWKQDDSLNCTGNLFEILCNTLSPNLTGNWKNSSSALVYL